MLISRILTGIAVVATIAAAEPHALRTNDDERMLESAVELAFLESIASIESESQSDSGSKVDGDMASSDSDDLDDNLRPQIEKPTATSSPSTLMPNTSTVAPDAGDTSLNKTSSNPNASTSKTWDVSTTTDEPALTHPEVPTKVDTVTTPQPLPEAPVQEPKTETPLLSTEVPTSDVDDGSINLMTVVPSTNPSNSGTVLQVEPWKQCGGFGFDYSKYSVNGAPATWSTKLSCTAGYSCEEVDAWFYQCQPINGVGLVDVWDQCGGTNHLGSTECTMGSVCKYVNEWYSQCVPGYQSSGPQ